MTSFRFLLLMVLLVVTGTQGFLTKKINGEENADTGDTYFQGIKTIAQDVKDTLSLKKKTVVDAFSAIGNAKHGIIENIKDSKRKLVENVVASHLAKMNAIKAAKDEYMKTIMAEKQPFHIFQNKLQKIKEAVPTLPPIDGLKSRLLNYVINFFGKFQGHWKQHKKDHNGSFDTLFAFIPHSISNGHSQVEGIAGNEGERNPEINFFPSGALPSEVTFPQANGTPSEYVQPVQVESGFESVQTQDSHSDFQQSQFPSSSDYIESTQDDFVPAEYSTVDFNDHRSIPYSPSLYYGPPPTSN